MIRKIRLQMRASAHEVRCGECRVSWRSWARRLVTLDRPPVAWRSR